MRRDNVKKRLQQMLVGFISVFLFTPVLAQGSAFSSGSVRLSGGVSATSVGNDSYLRVGIGAGYYVIDGLELGLDINSRVGGDYSVHELEPSATYALPTGNNFRPYGGVFYRRTFIEDRDNLSAYGGRAGVFLQQSRNMHVRAGVVGIRYRDCDDAAGIDCSDVYPEVSVGLYF